jgi:hypothetical protein
MIDPADCFDQLVDGMVEATPEEWGNESDKADPPMLPSRTDLLWMTSGALSCAHARSSSRANLRISSTATSRAVSTTCFIPNLGNLEDFGVPGRPPTGNGERRVLGLTGGTVQRWGDRRGGTMHNMTADTVPSCSRGRWWLSTCIWMLRVRGSDQRCWDLLPLLLENPPLLVNRQCDCHRKALGPLRLRQRLQGLERRGWITFAILLGVC